jgi:GTP-binding protein
MLVRKSLARTSSEPGKTRQINFYNVDNNFYFVDLPGYGFSKMSKEEQVKVGEFIEHYLSNRKQIALIVFLIDIRHSPTENDIMMYNYIINTGFPCLILANKADKLAPTKVDKAVSDLQEELNPLNDLKFLPFSSEKRVYLEAVWKEIDEKLN